MATPRQNLRDMLSRGARLATLPPGRARLAALVSGQVHVVVVTALAMVLAGATVAGVAMAGVALHSGKSPLTTTTATSAEPAAREAGTANRSMDRAVPTAQASTDAATRADTAAQAAAEAAAAEAAAEAAAQKAAAEAATAKAAAQMAADKAAAERAAADKAAADKAAAERAAAGKGAADKAAAERGPAAVPAGCEKYSDNQLIACKLLPQFGFSVSEQMPALVNLWNSGSNGNQGAVNPGSGANGIAQSLPGDKYATAGPDWRTNPTTQIRWGLRYLKESYGTPQHAWNMWQSRSPHWY